MTDIKESVYISSKEILEKAGISRATLNNYIKLGIVPRPIVRKPEKQHKNIKSLGYFPETVLDKLSDLKRLKKEGMSMDDIAIELSESPLTSQDDFTSEIRSPDQDDRTVTEEKQLKRRPKKNELSFSIEGLEDSAFLIDYDFEITWISKLAEKKIIFQNISQIEKSGSRNLFHFLFSREFQHQVQNWKDHIEFFMSFAKLKYAKTWMKRLYKDISQREVHILENIYDNTGISHDKPIQDAKVEVKKTDGSVEYYRVYIALFNEGILFNYVQE